MQPLGRGDLAFAADLHTRALPHGFFPKLGTAFMRRYYATFLRSPWAAALVATTEEGRVGVLVGTFDDGAHYRFVARRFWFPLVVSGSSALARRPAVAWWFLRTRGRRYARGLVRLAGLTDGNVGGGAPAAVAQVGVLAHLAVVESARGKGAGGELVATFVEQARRRGGSHLRLVTHSSAGAAQFYERLGWALVGERDGLDGTAWTEFRLDLT
ncbi:MAG: GNAT family N-acetyltransferase [Acidimicrobiales bacterium]